MSCIFLSISFLIFNSVSVPKTSLTKVLFYSRQIHDQKTQEEVWYKIQHNQSLSLRDFAHNGKNLLNWFLTSKLFDGK
jgi:hypothetical protein